jgi:bacterioferritin
MKGNTKIIAALNGLLASELAAMDQYFIHSRMYQDWGLNKLYEHNDHEFDEEKGHAAVLIERILFLEGVPDMTQRKGFKVGTDVVAMLESDLRVEYSVGQELKEVIALCEQEQDYVTRDNLMVLLKDTEEDHTFWLETQLGLIQKVGMENYLQSQMESGAPE